MIIGWGNRFGKYFVLFQQLKGLDLGLLKEFQKFQKYLRE